MFFGTSPCFRVSRSAGVSGFIILYNITIKLKPFHRMMYIYLQEKTYSGWLSKKQFPFNEKLAMHLLHYQQVRYIIYSRVDFYPVILSRLALLSDHLMQIGKILSGM